jgi:hypothetical protein
MKVLIVGGYGVFGGNLARLLADEPRLTLLVAGRSLEKAKGFCAALPARATLVPTRFDREGDLAGQLEACAPDLVVDATGPFQAYGAAPWRLVEACIARGTHYLDLADAVEFVLGIEAFDAAARAKGVFVLSGLSTCPALTAAAVRRMTRGWRAVTGVAAGIAPSPHAGVGANVVRALAGYAGRPVSRLKDGKAFAAPALVESRRAVVAPRGAVPLRSTRFSLVAVPDLALLPRQWPELRDIWFGAGPRPAVFHDLFSLCARLVQAGLIPTLAPLAGLFHRVISLIHWGEHRGGMFVEAGGVDADGRAVRRSWNLVAEGADGPLIPSIASAAVIMRTLEGRPPAAGARPADRDLELEDFEPFFAAHRIVTGVRDALPASAPVYAQVLGPALEALPPAVRAMHDLSSGTLTASGRAKVERGRGPLSALIAAVIGFPGAVEDTPVSVTFGRDGAVETWSRDFGGQRFGSLQYAGAGRSLGLVVEAFGPLACGMAAVVGPGKMTLVARRWTAFGNPMPLWLMPRIEAFEAEVDGRFRFHVDIGHPLCGRIVRYQGWLEIARTRTHPAPAPRRGPSGPPDKREGGGRR